MGERVRQILKDREKGEKEKLKDRKEKKNERFYVAKKLDSQKIFSVVIH